MTDRCTVTVCDATTVRDIRQWIHNAYAEILTVASWDHRWRDVLWPPDRGSWQAGLIYDASLIMSATARLTFYRMQRNKNDKADQALAERMGRLRARKSKPWYWMNRMNRMMNGMIRTTSMVWYSYSSHYTLDLDYHMNDNVKLTILLYYMLWLDQGYEKMMWISKHVMFHLMLCGGTKESWVY